MGFRDIAADEFEQMARRQVAAAFEANRKLPDTIVETEVPLIGGKYNPHAPPERIDHLQRWAVRALCCSRWAETELPPWMLPLPLTAKECYRLFSHWNANRRAALRGMYGQHLRDWHWDYTKVLPFETFVVDPTFDPSPGI